MSSGLYNKVSKVEFARRPYFVDCWKCKGFGLLFDHHDDDGEYPCPNCTCSGLDPMPWAELFPRGSARGWL